MTRFLAATRYLIVVPIIGLALASAAFFVFGGLSLIVLLVEAVTAGLGITEAHGDSSLIIIEGVD